jgi:hypothetical protein
MAFLGCIDRDERTARTELWTFGCFASRVGTTRLPYGAHVLVLRRHAQTAIQANVSSRRLVCGATATMLSGSVAWRKGVVEWCAGKAVAFMTRCGSQRRRVDERHKERL